MTATYRLASREMWGWFVVAWRASFRRRTSMFAATSGSRRSGFGAARGCRYSLGLAHGPVRDRVQPRASKPYRSPALRSAPDRVFGHTLHCAEICACDAELVRFGVRAAQDFGEAFGCRAGRFWQMRYNNHGFVPFGLPGFAPRGRLFQFRRSNRLPTRAVGALAPLRIRRSAGQRASLRACVVPEITGRT